MTNEINKNLSKLEEIAHLEDHVSISKQIKLVNSISQTTDGLVRLLDLLIERKKEKQAKLAYLDGIIFKCLYNCSVNRLKNKLETDVGEGIVTLKSNYNMDYKPLFVALVSNDLQKADILTQRYLTQLAKLKTGTQRQWLYFTDVSRLPIQDLQTIDKLWTMYSAGQFGFSTQRRIWLYSNKNWEKFWHVIGWKVKKKSVRYPQGFTWNNTAPIGHLPLFNQIRGVQVLATLFQHPAWDIEQPMSK